MSIIDRYEKIVARIDNIKQKYVINERDVLLLVVSKKQPITKIKQIAMLGQKHFGESYIQEAVPKIKELQDFGLIWHFIGRIQSNKAKLIANWFDWVHSIDSKKIAESLNKACADLKDKKLNVCVQVNIDNSSSKGGVQIQELSEMVDFVASLPNLRLRGFMSMLDFSNDVNTQFNSFKKLHELFCGYKAKGYSFDTLSMGMSNDYEAAIKAHSSMVRIGSLIFGKRD